ncbi:MAG: hypothetical protein LUF85_11235 [Bacteroides sp.]|nr:hypothetical protein [Bacteroides sp.]
MIKQNGINVQGQKNIFDILRKEIVTSYDLIDWHFYPSYKQLSYILGLAWDNLLVPGETTKPMTKNRLIYMTFNYSQNQNIYKLIEEQFSYLQNLNTYQSKNSADIRDEAIQFTFQTMKHWFQYKVPKWLAVMNEIQKFICAERRWRSGSYIYYASLIENDFLRENLAILMEYGVPSSAIRKLEKYIPQNLSQDNVFSYIKDYSLYTKQEFLDYERNKIMENL